jgi:N-acetylglucosaminyldiphosphoundecaprenol N-acetyl-beta-D-mannosaminyltransferase
MVNQLSPSRQKVLIPFQKVLDFSITALRFDDQIQTILRWASSRESRTVCVANVHMLMEAHWNSALADVLDKADLVTPDGMPLVWMMRQLGAYNQDRVAGMDILLALCEQAQTRNVSVFFVGSQTEILDPMKSRIESEFPNLKIAGMEPLPFRQLTQAEDEALIKKVNESGAGVVLVSLGCPKQEYWMAQHKGKIQAVMIGLGGVFPIYAGIHKWAPQWVRESGLEWLYRLVQEPRRLWGRYSKTIPPFMLLASKQLLMHRIYLLTKNRKYGFPVLGVKQL